MSDLPLPVAARCIVKGCRHDEIDSLRAQLAESRKVIAAMREKVVNFQKMPWSHTDDRGPRDLLAELDTPSDLADMMLVEAEHYKEMVRFLMKREPVRDSLAGMVLVSRKDVERVGVMLDSGYSRSRIADELRAMLKEAGDG